jgi:hypothetical protein
MTNFVIRTQVLENYGAHAEDGKFSSQNHYWKMKGGIDYLVQDLDRVQDAAAFVMATFSSNSLGYKEFPVEFLTEEEWVDRLPDDEEYRDFIKEQVWVVSPKTGRNHTRGYPEDF